MTVFVLYHKERFLLDPMHPIWQHYDPFKWWLLPHGLAGAFALLLGGCPRIRYSNDYLLMGFRKNLNYPDAKLQIDQILHSFLLKLVHIGLIQSIFTYIAGFTVKFPNSGRINPVIMALAIFLKLCAAQTIENSPATFSLPRTLKPRKPLFLI